MFIDSGCYTRDVSQTIATQLNYLREHPDTYVRLHLTYERPVTISGPVGEQVLDVTLDATRPSTTLANGVQVIRCISREHEPVDIFLAHPAEMSIQPALVLVGKGAPTP